jgi:DNA-binding LacI/PurR family transcriptional regulator
MEERSKKRGRSLRAGDVYDSLMERISGGSFPVGEYLPSERSLIGEFGVSRPTVRKALQRLEREGYLVCHAGIGYEVVSTERAQAGGETKLIGVLWAPGERGGPADPRLPMIEGELTSRGYTMVLGFTGRDVAAENKRVDAFLELGVAGLVALPAQRGKGRSNLGELVREGFPLMAVGEPSRWAMGNRLADSCSFVGLDNGLGSRLALEHLQELGHRRIAFARCGANPAMTRRERGYRDWMAEQDLDPGEEWVISCAEARDRVPIERLRALAESSGGGPTAVLCETVDEAVGVAEALKQMGVSIPEGVSLAAFFGGLGDEPQIRGRTLTGLDYSWADFTREIVEGLVAQIKNRSIVRRTLLRPRFVAGETVAPPAEVETLKSK